MNQHNNTIIVDLQGFKDSKNKFIVKEIAISTQEYTQIFLVKPPYSFSRLSSEEKKQVKWIENNRGITWSEGFIDYQELKRTIIPYLFKKNIMTKGSEKIKWIQELCKSCNTIDIGEKGCPNFLKLHTLYKEFNFNCVNHKKYCALKNVLCIKKWYEDNNMYQFDLFS